MKEQKKITGIVSSIIVILAIVLQIIIGVYENHIRSISGDEIFSLGLANNTGEYVFFTDQEIERFSNDAGWFSGSYYHNYITVQPDERWRYDNVYAKQKADVHPPLYYSLVHTISSFTPDTLNYAGIAGINIVAICGEILLLYLMMRKLFGNTIYNVLPCILWSFSAAAMELRDYIRMYALLNSFVLCMIYLHICLIVEKEVTRKRILQIALVVCLGGLTHYYFYMYTFFVAGIYLVMQIWMARKHLPEKKIFLMKYVGGYLLGGGIALLIFPKAVYHVLKTNVGNQVKGNLISGTMQIGETWGIIHSNVFYNKFFFVLILLSVFFLCLFTIGKTHKTIEVDKQENKSECIGWQEYISILIMLGGSVLCYLLLLMKVTIYVAWYYISPVFAPIMLFFLLLFSCGYMMGEKIWSWAAAGILIAGSLCLFYTHQVSVLQEKVESNQNYQQMIDSFSGKDCIYVSESWNCLYGNHLPDMAVMDEVRCIKEEDYMQTDFNALLQGRETADEDIVLIFRKVESTDKYVEEMASQTGKKVDEIWSDEKNSFYLIHY